jgi:hypothetical protein
VYGPSWASTWLSVCACVLEEQVATAAVVSPKPQPSCGRQGHVHVVAVLGGTGWRWFHQAPRSSVGTRGVCERAEQGSHQRCPGRSQAARQAYAAALVWVACAPASHRCWQASWQECFQPLNAGLLCVWATTNTGPPAEVQIFHSVNNSEGGWQ